MLDLRDWRLGERNVWKVERMLLEGRDASRRQTSAWTACGGGIVLSVTRTATSRGECYRGRDRWTALPPKFRHRG